MTETSYPWTGSTVGDAGAYSATQWNEAWGALHRAKARVSAYASRGPLMSSGVLPSLGLQVTVTAPVSGSVEVAPGSALVEGTYYDSSNTETLTPAANASGNPRIDTIVLRKNYAAQTVRLAILQGSPAATPTPPSLTQTLNTLWEVPLADITLANGFTNINQADIMPRHEWVDAAPSVYIDVLNSSGVPLNTGSVVIWNSGADRSVVGTTTLHNRRVAGVWVGRTGDGSYGRILTHGIGYVYVTGTVALLDRLYASATAYQATNVGGVPAASIGHALEARTGAGLVLAYIDVNYFDPLSGASMNKSGTQTVGAGGTSTVAWDVEVYDDNGYHDNVSNNSRLTAVVDGLYNIFTNIDSSGTAGNWGLSLRLNGTTILATSAPVTGSVSLGFTVRLSAGDYIEVRATNNSGGSRDIATTSVARIELLKRTQ